MIWGHHQKRSTIRSVFWLLAIFEAWGLQQYEPCLMPLEVISRLYGKRPTIICNNTFALQIFLNMNSLLIRYTSILLNSSIRQEKKPHFSKPSVTFPSFSKTHRPILKL